MLYPRKECTCMMKEYYSKHDLYRNKAKRDRALLEATQKKPHIAPHKRSK